MKAETTKYTKHTKEHELQTYNHTKHTKKKRHELNRRPVVYLDAMP